MNAPTKPTQNVRKLSVATVWGKIDLKELLKAPDEAMTLMTVLGSGVSTKTGTHTYGDWTALQGMFEATNAETGEVFQSSTLFLPDVALTPILVQLAGPGVTGIEFAIEVGVKYARNAKPGGAAYEYTWRPLLPPDENDPISRIKARLLALPAPAASDDGTAEAKPAKVKAAK